MGTVCDENDENIVKIDFVLKDEGDDESLVSYWCHTGKSLLPRSDIGLNTTPMRSPSKFLFVSSKFQRLSWMYFVLPSNNQGLRASSSGEVVTLGTWLTSLRVYYRQIFTLPRSALLVSHLFMRI
mmetsp:Transcript_36058/g.81045  ORF Transcript_36058/g.81045 Transcript_36058/m.81045 type:complete len:125 (+) Transcript_36058:856-1230(+)